MTRMSVMALGIVAAILLSPVVAQQNADEVTLRIVKHDGLNKEVLKNRGKVVLVDFWADFCKPCKDAFPHTVELHRKYSASGLAVISVALDSLEEDREQVVAKVTRFLKKQNATFANLLLDEPDAVWQKRFRMDGPPCIYVFSRLGLWRQLTAQELEDNPQALDRLVEELLADKDQ